MLAFSNSFNPGQNLLSKHRLQTEGVAKVLGGSNVDVNIFLEICQGDHAGPGSCMFHHEGEIIKMIRNNGSAGESIVGRFVING